MTPHSALPSSAETKASRRALEASQSIRLQADRLFYNNGVLETSMREIARAAHVSLSRLMRMHLSKEHLVLDYLANRHLRDVHTLGELTGAETTPREALRGALDDIVTELLTPGFRGCAFLNASSEAGHHYPSIRTEVYAHRGWYTTETTRLLRAAGHPRPADAADDLLLARDGGMASIHGGNVLSAVSAMRRSISRAFDDIA